MNKYEKWLEAHPGSAEATAIKASQEPAFVTISNHGGHWAIDTESYEMRSWGGATFSGAALQGASYQINGLLAAQHEQPPTAEPAADTLLMSPRSFADLSAAIGVQQRPGVRYTRSRNPSPSAGVPAGPSDPVPTLSQSRAHPGAFMAATLAQTSSNVMGLRTLIDEVNHRRQEPARFTVDVDLSRAQSFDGYYMRFAFQDQAVSTRLDIGYEEILAAQTSPRGLSNYLSNMLEQGRLRLLDGLLLHRDTAVNFRYLDL